jgi:hypothetical protein
MGGKDTMHASSFENMRRCYRRYLAGTAFEQQAETIVVDIGGADVNGSYREIFAHAPFLYRVVDTAAVNDVDIALSDPYSFPIADSSIDIVISGQALEHSEFFWQTFSEMVRVVKREGFIFLILPSAGPIHRFPVDCYRFYPDAYQALAKHAGCVLIESWLDERGPWRDLVGVFRRADAPALATVAGSAELSWQEWTGPTGTPDEEAIAGCGFYLDVLDRIHQILTPRQYLEIGVRHGNSLALARGSALGVDPAPAVDRPLPASTRIVSLESDDFFRAHRDEIAPDLGFIDGLHLFEQALRDFMNFERCAAPGAVAIIDDIFPNHPAQALRERRTRVWTGDVWRLADVLHRYRPDLFLLPLDVSPGGFLLVAGLDPANRVLWDDYNPLVREARERSGPPASVLARHGALDPSDDKFDHALRVIARARTENCSPSEIVARLRRMHDAQAIPRGRSGVPKISLIVVCYNMARELPRTIRSLSPLMQRDIDPQDYEVILIDNGSTQVFDESELRRFLPDLVVHRVENATPSPVPAINVGLALARADLVGVSIDGARMATPGLFAQALAASRLHCRPVIGTIAFHLGALPQIENIKHGYNQAVEDALVASIGWETDGYRLFEISTFAQASVGGWFAVPHESNTFFLRAEHWRSLGGWDERFVTPGGGYANLDTWARACSDPEAQLILLLGEATFHQFHGGIATNNPDAPLALFREEYERLRGCPPDAPKVKPLFVGTLSTSMTESLRRSAELL